MYSSNNNHNKPPRPWLLTLSKTLIIDSNTQSAIPLSLDISLLYTNLQVRENDDDYQYQVDLDLSLLYRW